MKSKILILYLSVAAFCKLTLVGQGVQVQSIEDVISGIDSLLKEIDGVSSNSTDQSLQPSVEDRPFRAENELMPQELIKDTDPVPSAIPEVPQTLPSQVVVIKTKNLLPQELLISQNYL